MCKVNMETAAVQETMTLHQVMQEIVQDMGMIGKKGFLNTAAKEWLFQAGLLSREPGEDGTDCSTTWQGEAFGLSVQVKESKDGLYTTVLCGGKMPELLREHQWDILGLERQQWNLLLACITPEWTARTKVLAGPVSPTKFINYINGSLPQDLPRKLNIRDVNTWLVGKGVLEDVFVEGKRCKCPTASGQALGFKAKSYNGATVRGVDCWEPSAQQFVLDRIIVLIRDLSNGEAFRLVPHGFHVTEKLLDQLTQAQQTLPQSTLFHRSMTEWINGVLEPATGFKVPSGLIAAWLANEGYLEMGTQKDGRKLFLPTGQGLEIGLSVVEGKDYQAVAYEEKAQRFVAQHLEDIVDLYRRW